ncbi:MAG: hypothetical protein GXO28_02850 [Methanopyri archaeon]|nr:hypothetical protein [Methanopyri archaeon]
MNVVDAVPFDSISILGLGVEGKTCALRLAEMGFKVYASDLRKDLDVSDLENLDNVKIDLGRHDPDAIAETDVAYVSPSAPRDSPAFKAVEKAGVPLLEDVITWPDDSDFIAITGTNGKTTTVLMTSYILEELNVEHEVGGNAGGGFDGYATLYVLAEATSPEVVVCEVCDMTLGYFVERGPKPTVAALTNVGLDHMDHHGSLENLIESAAEFLNVADVAVLRCDADPDAKVANMVDVRKVCYDRLEIDPPFKSRVYRWNAKAAVAVSCEVTGRDPDELVDVLEGFRPADGRVVELILDDGRVVVGKTDNPSALESVLRDFGPLEVVFWGTPRPGEWFRVEGVGRILARHGVERVYVFPGLSRETIDDVVREMERAGLTVEGVADPEEVPNLVMEELKGGVNSIGVLGNGQDVITWIQKRLEEAAKEVVF